MPNSALRSHRPLRLIGVLATVIALITGCMGQVVAPSASAPPGGFDFRRVEQQAMLFQADQEDGHISANGVQWRNDFGQPEPSQLVNTASVWLLYYPGSVITKPGQSVIGTWADTPFWDAVRNVGVTLLHTNPVQRAGAWANGKFTPTIDGWFDRIGLDTAPELGTEAQFKQLVQVAAAHKAIIAHDLVPLHTGLGPDFRLAERGYKDYPGLYDMVEIQRQDWGLLPGVTDPWATALVPRAAAVQLKAKGYIPGLIHSADADPQANTWSGWSATPELAGVDGKTHRYVYLHVFKPAQPALNWLDPTFAAQRVQYGDTARNVVDRGVKVLRLDADTFLGLEPQPNNDMAQTYLTPLANVSTTDIAFSIRKSGGFSYQEFAAPLAQLKEFAPHGPDLSYDFFTRAENLVPLINGDVLPLRLAHHFILDAGVSEGSLIHDLQNHDEITFQLFELGSHDTFQYEGQTLNGKQLKNQVLDTMRTTVGAVPYNKLYRPEKDGVATTFAGFIAPALGIKDPYHATPAQVAQIRRAHLLVAQANAMLPGAFAVSAWDLVGALPVPANSIPSNLTAGGDWRWVNRGAVDLMGANPTATKSAFGLPKATALYGPLPAQLKDPNSFASQLKRMLAARAAYHIPDARLVLVPNVGNRSVCVLVMQLPNTQNLALNVLNYGRTPASVQVDLTQVPPGIPASSLAGKPTLDIITNQGAGTVGSDGHLKIDLQALSGRTIVVERQ